MKLINVKKVIMMVTILLVGVLLTNSVFATDANNLNNLMDRLNEMQQTSGGNVTGEGAETIPEGNKVGELPTNNNTNNTNVNQNKPTTTPHTGIESSSSIVFIGILAVSAVYAYKKIKEYNV